MNKYNSPLSLSATYISAYDADSELANNYPGFEYFDFRHDFLVTPRQSGLAVMMMFVNNRNSQSYGYRGIRRRVNVSLIDMTDNSLEASTSVMVNINRYQNSTSIRVDFPLAYTNINFGHTYKISVSDQKTCTHLGDEKFNFFSDLQCGTPVSDWFIATSGGIDIFGSNELSRAFDIATPSFPKVRFNLLAGFGNTPDILPEIEVRVYSPFKDVETRFCRVECEYSDMHDYYVEMPFLIDRNNKGICYAEIVCMDIAIAGFVFNSDDKCLEGPWTGSALSPLDEYTPEAAIARYNEFLRYEIEGQPTSCDLLEHQPDEEETSCNETTGCEENPQQSTDDKFENLLNEFISQQSDKCDSDTSSDINETEPHDNDNKMPTDNNVIETSIVSNLDKLTGLHSVKEKLLTYEKLVKFNMKRRELGLPVASAPLHAMFLGSPGTGKTTVAKMMGRMLADAGILSSGHVVVRERSTLLGPNYSMEEKNTLDAIEEAQGGILLIDEAYLLHQPNDPRDPGKFVIQTLLSILADENRRDWMLILAGYPDEMKKMFELNPGFKSRIPDSNFYFFEDFSETELMEIAERYFDSYGFSLPADTRLALANRISDDYTHRDRTFGNARHIVNLIQTEIIPAMARRVISTGIFDKETLTEIQSADIPAAAHVIAPRQISVGFRA